MNRMNLFRETVPLYIYDDDPAEQIYLLKFFPEIVFLYKIAQPNILFFYKMV